MPPAGMVGGSCGMPPAGMVGGSCTVWRNCGLGHCVECESLDKNNFRVMTLILVLYAAL